MRRVSAAENLSVCLVSEGEILCLLNPSNKTDVKMSVTQTFIELFTFSICRVMFGFLSSGFSIRTAPYRRPVSVVVVFVPTRRIQLRKGKAGLCKVAF